MTERHETSHCPPLSSQEIEIVQEQIGGGAIERYIERYAGIHSRHVSYKKGNEEAVAMLFEDLDAAGRGQLWFRRHLFTLEGNKEQTRANVEALLPGVRSPYVIIISAHLDCTAERDTATLPAKSRAPGADDDASGMAGVMAAVRAILALTRTRPGEPRAEIRFIFFNAEEQGQRGSRVYAKQQKRAGVAISAVYQMDMIGYRSRGNEVFELHAGFRENPAVEAASVRVARHLAEMCGAVELPLTPQIYFQQKKSRDPGQGFSDHTSFHRHGFPAVMISEDFFPGQETFPTPGDANRDYHTLEDLPGNLDTRYTANIVRAVTAAAWHRATRIGCCQGGPASAEHQQEPESGNFEGGHDH